jgi:2-iminobutanoate/2-iminopropanoate deaminase
MSHSRETVNAPDAPEAVGPYSHAVSVRGLLFCSGQVALDPGSGELVGDTAAEQTRQCLENLSAVARAGGGELANAVRCTVYLADMGEFAAVNEVYAEYFGESLPARVAFGVAALPKGGLVEIDAIIALER